MQIIRRSLESRQIFGKSADIILASWRSGTQKQYNTYINKWVSYCCKEQIDCLSPSVGKIIAFLTTLFEQGLSYSSLNTARSALSCLITIDGSAAGCHPLVVRFLKGTYNLKKPVSRYKSIWDVNVVLGYLQSLSPVASLDLKGLTHKLVMLMSITTAQRLQTLHMLNIGLMKIEPLCLVFCFDTPLN